MDICQNRPKSKSNIVQIIESKSNIFGIDPALLNTIAASGTRKPENPNFENETRQTRTRIFVK